MATGTLTRHCIRCAHCGGQHETVAQVLACKIEQDYADQRVEQDAAAERAALRHLEDRGYDDARAQEWYDSQRMW